MLLACCCLFVSSSLCTSAIPAVQWGQDGTELGDLRGHPQPHSLSPGLSSSGSGLASLSQAFQQDLEGWLIASSHWGWEGCWLW